MQRSIVVAAGLGLVLGCRTEPAARRDATGGREAAVARAGAPWPSGDREMRPGASGDARRESGAPRAPEAPCANMPPVQETAPAVLRIASRSDVPLVGASVEAQPGDWMIRGEAAVAVVSAEGRVIDFGPVGGRDDLHDLEPVAFDGLDRLRGEVVAIAPTDAGGALHVVRRLASRPLVLETWLRPLPSGLAIDSIASSTDTRTGAAPIAVTLGEAIGWGDTPTWVEGHGLATSGGTLAGAFLAHERGGLAQALCSESGRLVARLGSPELHGFHGLVKTGEEVSLVAPGGSTPRRSVALVSVPGSVGDAAMALPCSAFARAERRRIALPPNLPPGAWLDVARCADATGERAPFGRFAANGAPPGSLASTAHRAAIEIPAGCFELRLAAPGHAPGPWLSPEAFATAADPRPRAGRLVFRVTERGRPVPAKLVVRGVPPTPDPDWGETPDRGAALDAIHAESGQGERALPPGRYRVLVHRGPEYELVERIAHVAHRRETRLDVALERVVDTRGFVAADLHVHAAPSFDAPISLEDRVRSLVAVGIEVAVATDHNAITDYGPTIRAMGLARHVAGIVGDEITTAESTFGHYNAFPLRPDAAPIPWAGTTPGRAFAAARAAGPPGVTPIVQINHPRMGSIGYFDLLRFDPGDVRAWKARARLADWAFDAIEVWNGDDYADLPKVERCLRDFWALLDAGHRFVATGNSDSHKLTYQDPGVPRTWVAVPNDDPGAFDLHAFVSALRAGRAIVSSGPFVRFEANGRPVGSTVAAGAVELSVRVEAPRWIDVARVEIVRRGRTIRAFAVPPSRGPVRFERRWIEPLEKGDWVVAIVRGERPMTPLRRPGALPFAFTNPIRVE